jgi:hypothetical protein
MSIKLPYFPRGFEIYDVATKTSHKPYQIRYVRTAVGWYNVYLIGLDGAEQCINLSPAEFFDHFPSVSPRAVVGCMDVGVDVVEALGFDVEFVIEREAATA